MLRFGWIDGTDWQAQRTSSGQQATLNDNVYKCKLKVVKGAYLRQNRVETVKQIGPKIAEKYRNAGIVTIEDLLTTEAVEDSSLVRRQGRDREAARHLTEDDYF